MQRSRLLHPDPRLAQAFSLLREVLDGGAANGAAEPQAWSGGEGPATDPLADPLATLGPDLLDSDFGTLWQPLAFEDEPSAVLPASSYRHWLPPSDFHASEGLAAF